VSRAVLRNSSVYCGLRVCVARGIPPDQSRSGWVWAAERRCCPSRRGAVAVAGGGLRRSRESGLQAPSFTLPC